MGEIADLMLEGVLCEHCGVALYGEAPGHPRYCSKRCKRAATPGVPKATKIDCPTCKKRVKRSGLRDHMRDAHAKKESTNA